MQWDFMKKVVGLEGEGFLGCTTIHEAFAFECGFETMGNGDQLMISNRDTSMASWWRTKRKVGYQDDRLMKY